jgi:hypothetical protein
MDPGSSFAARAAPTGRRQFCFSPVVAAPVALRVVVVAGICATAERREVRPVVE